MRLAGDSGLKLYETAQTILTGKKNLLSPTRGHAFCYGPVFIKVVLRGVSAMFFI